MKFFAIFYIAVALWGVIGCGGVAPIVVPEEAYEDPTSGEPGTQNLQVSAVYPSDDTGIVPVDTDVIIVFNKEVDGSSLTGNVTVAGAPSFSTVVSTDKKVARLQFATDLSADQTYTVSVTTGVTDINGNALVPDISDPENTDPYEEDFLTAPSSADLYDPQLLGIYPVNGATGISTELEYVEIYFSKDIDAVTVTSSSFSITGGAASGAPVQVVDRTFRLYLNTLAYNTTYTVTLTAAITDTDGNALVSAPIARTFTTETNPTPTGASTITSYWISDVETDQAVINWITDVQTEDLDTAIDYGTGTDYGTSTTEGSYGSYGTVHSKTITSLGAATKYYYEITWDDGANNDAVTGSFVTAEDSGSSDDDSIDSNATGKSSLDLVQASSLTGYTGRSYAFWSSSSNNCYGQFFETNGSPLWGASGSQVHDTEASLRSFSDGIGGALLTIDDSSGFYVKHLYDVSGALTFNPGNGTLSAAGWDDDNSATGNGLTFGHTAGYSSPSAAMVYSGISNNITAEFVTKVVPGPSISTPNVVEMPSVADGYLIYDEETNFSSLSMLGDDDYIIEETDLSYNSGNFYTNFSTMDFSTMTDPFIYTIYENDGTDSIGTAMDYVLIDADSVISGNADGNYLLPPSGASDGGTVYTTDDMSQVSEGDIVVNAESGDPGENRYSYVETVTTGATYDTIVLGHDILIDDGDDFVVYRRILGDTDAEHVSADTETVSNPLWDNNANFSSVNTLQTWNDVVLNSYNGTPQISTVSSIDANNRALRLAANIMADNENYWIVSLAATGTSTILAFGARDSGDAVNILRDAAGYYGNINNAVVGDIVYNITDNTYAAVIADNGTVLTLSRNIVTSTTDTDAYLVLDSANPVLDLGVCTSNGTNRLNDTGANFVNGGVRAGDILYHDNGAGGYDVFVITGVAATRLTISGNTVSGRHYYIIQPRAFFAWHDNASPTNIRAAIVNLRDGSLAVSSFMAVDHASNNVQDTHVISDGSGGAFVIYEDSTGNTIRGKRLSAAGAFLVGTNAANLGVNLGTGSIIDVISDGSTGIYVLYDNGVNVALRRWGQSLDGTTWAAAVTLTTTGNDAAIVLSSAGNPIVAFADDSNDLYIQERTAASGVVDPSFNETIVSIGSYVSNESADITKNNVTLSRTGNGGAFAGWIDNRYYSFLGYQAMAQAYDAVGAPQWDADTGTGTDYEGITVGVTGNYDPEMVADEALIRSVFSGSGSPASGHYFWYDYRNTRTDIFYDILAY